MAETSCGDCSIRAKYDNNPKSFLGRLWRWHANWCPGWKEHMNSLAEDEKQKIAKQYDMKKFMN